MIGGDTFQELECDLYDHFRFCCFLLTNSSVFLSYDCVPLQCSSVFFVINKRLIFLRSDWIKHLTCRQVFSLSVVKE